MELGFFLLLIVDSRASKIFNSKNFYHHLGPYNCFLSFIKLNNLDVSGPKFLSTPSVTIGGDGLSYIVGCKYVVEELQVDLAAFAYLVVNQTVKRKLNGSSRRLNENTFQLPQHIFIVPGEYKCVIEAKSLYKEPINSNLSAYISMPGRII